MTTSSKQVIKNILGQIPFTAELYWLVRQRGNPIQSRFSLRHLQNAMPNLVQEADSFRKDRKSGKNIFIFSTLHYWIEHTALLGIALAAQGHKVTLGYLPYAEWQAPINRFDLRRQNAYAGRVLGQAASLLNPVSFLNVRPPTKKLPDAVAREVELVTRYDTQYTLQIEEVDESSETYQLRFNRNQEAALNLHAWLFANRPDVAIIPNGTVQELGVAYRIARFLRIPTVTYEFGDQRQRIWLAHNAEVMRQETDGLWEARQNVPLSDSELEQLKCLFTSRQHASLWENFARRWQDTPPQGGGKIRQDLGLDERPVVLLATNVLGDSLTLGRQIFSKTMADWISRTVQYFAGREDVQLVVRVHPGEVLTHGISMVDVVKGLLPRLPAHIHLVGPREKLNTYDLVEIADLGLVYTTTVGLEMAMSGKPVLVAGKTHYRNRGFTIDPDSWVAYFKQLGQILEKPGQYRLAREQVEQAWQYAYRFFFEFPQPFPWHLVRMWEDYNIRPLKSVLNEKGLSLYGNTFRYLSGEPIDWNLVSGKS
jgi:hypothetical protein